MSFRNPSCARALFGHASAGDEVVRRRKGGRSARSITRGAAPDMPEQRAGRGGPMNGFDLYELSDLTCPNSALAIATTALPPVGRPDVALSCTYVPASAARRGLVATTNVSVRAQWPTDIEQYTSGHPYPYVRRGLARLHLGTERPAACASFDIGGSTRIGPSPRGGVTRSLAIGAARVAHRPAGAPAGCARPHRARSRAALSRSVFHGAARRGPGGRSDDCSGGSIRWPVGAVVGGPGHSVKTHRVRPVRGASWESMDGGDPVPRRPPNPATWNALPGAARRPDCAWAAHQGRRR